VIQVQLIQKRGTTTNNKATTNSKAKTKAKTLAYNTKTITRNETITA
jgi:hypothetical protein